VRGHDLLSAGARLLLPAFLVAATWEAMTHTNSARTGTRNACRWFHLVMVRRIRYIATDLWRMLRYVCAAWEPEIADSLF